MSTEPDPIAKSLAVAATTIQQYKQSPSSKRALYLVQAAQRALDRARTVEECKDIHDALRGLEVYSKLRREDWKTAQTITMQRLMTEWKMGGILRETVQHQGGTVTTSNSVPEGISRKDSMNWQRIADFDQDDLRLLMTGSFDAEELSTSWAVRQWQKLHRHISIFDNGDEQEYHGPPPPDDDEIDGNYNLANYGEQLHILLSDCASAFKHISGHTTNKDILDVCERMRGRIDDLLAEL